MMYGLSQKRGEVVGFEKKRTRISFIKVKINSKQSLAINYNNLTGTVDIGDKVLLNTTAVELGLGTGGYHFVICNLTKINQEKNDEGQESKRKNNSGHIMKLRYTPYQVKTLSVEEPESNAHTFFKDNPLPSLKGLPVVIIPLHSLLAPLAITFKHYFKEKKVVYIMTEGGALFLELSNLVAQLKKKSLVDTTITVGQSIGGDIEAVNIFTGLIAAKKLISADLVIAGIGPGIIGTSTKLGFSGVENAFISYAVNKLGGKGIYVPRISLADKRSRHYIISHHTITLLQELIENRLDVVFPEKKFIFDKLKKTNISDLHNLFFYSEDKLKTIENILKKFDFKYKSMGRSLKEDLLFFITGGLPVFRYKKILEE